MSERQPDLPNRQTPFSEAFKAFIGEDWAPYPTTLPAPLPATGPARARREALSRAFPGERLVIPAGGLKVRSNDTDFGFRPHSAFAHLTGFGTDHEPDAALVLEPTDHGHEATLFVRPRVPRDSEEFYADTRVGEMWVGRRLSLEEFAALAGIATADLAELPDQVRKNADTLGLRLVTAADPELDALVAEIRAEQDGLDPTAATEADTELVVALSESRLVKDDFEIEQMREACRQTADGFEAVVAELPEAARRGRGERWIEGIFALHARHGGNDVGYSTIAAAGEHACTLHWIRNDGVVRPGELVLIDAGVELDTLYTADVTRTLPVAGRFSEAQRKVYEAVLEAQDAGIAAAQPGATFSDVHKAAIAVIAAAPGRLGAAPGQRRGVTVRPTVGSTAAGWCTAPRTISGSTCTTARRPATSTTGRAPWPRAWSSPSSRGSTSGPTTSWSPRSCAGSAYGSRTTS